MRRAVPFLTAGAAGRGSASKADVPSAPARILRRLTVGCGMGSSS